jgi:hypothetical protein
MGCGIMGLPNLIDGMITPSGRWLSSTFGVWAVSAIGSPGWRHLSSGVSIERYISDREGFTCFSEYLWMNWSLVVGLSGLWISEGQLDFHSLLIEFIR